MCRSIGRGGRGLTLAARGDLWTSSIKLSCIFPIRGEDGGAVGETVLPVNSNGGENVAVYN